MVQYYNEEKDEQGFIYSIDKIRISGLISGNSWNSLVDEFDFDGGYRDMRIIGPNAKWGGFEYIMLLQYDVNVSASVGSHLNIEGGRDVTDRGFIEFNPNKVLNYPQFQSDFEIIKAHMRFAKIERYDLAIDMPFIRNKIAMIKDNRIYECIRKSALDFTETLGKRNRVGRVKLYNKQIESDLDYPLTRLEITGDIDSFNIPSVVDLSKVPKSNKDLITSVLFNDDFTLALSAVSAYHRRQIKNYISNNILSYDERKIELVKSFAEGLI